MQSQSAEFPHFSERNYLAPVSGSIYVGYLPKWGANESIGVSPSKTTNTNEEHTQVYSSLTKQRHAESACVCFFSMCNICKFQMREKQQLFSSIEAVYRSFPVESFWGKSSANRSSWSKSYEILGLFLLAYHRIPSFRKRSSRIMMKCWIRVLFVDLPIYWGFFFGFFRRLVSWGFLFTPNLTQIVGSSFIRQRCLVVLVNSYNILQRKVNTFK